MDAAPDAIPDQAGSDGLFAVGRPVPLRTYLRDLWRRRDYLLRVPLEDLRVQNAHTLLGNLWLLLNPMLQVAVYLLVFGVLIDLDRGVDDYLAFLTVGVFVFHQAQRTVSAGARSVVANVGLFLLLALGLNIVVGLAGLLDLGYVAFFAVGGYTTSVLTSSNSPFFAPEWHFGIALLFVVVMAAVAGLLIGAPVIRMRGDYLAIVTLGFGEIVRLLFLSDWLKPYFGGSQGITKVNPVELGPFKVQGSDPRSVFYLVLVFCALAIYVSWRLQGSRLGRAWMATREDEQVAEAMGINTVNAKLMAFVVGATMAAFSGAVLAAKVGSVFPKSFEILVSIIILVVVIVGGWGNIAGVMVGSLVLIGILGGPRQPGLLQEFQSYKLLIYGALLVFMMLKRPEGLVPSARRSRELHQDEYLQDAWLGDDAESEEDQGAPS